MKYYFYPVRRKGNSTVFNPYCLNFQKELNKQGFVTNYNDISISPILNLLKHSFDSDIYFFNWIENIAHLRFSLFQTFVFYIILAILQIRRVKIIWTFHNIKPHWGGNIKSRLITYTLLHHSSLIITHSNVAYEYLKDKTNKTICFCNHPVHAFDNLHFEAIKKDLDVVDILIWGTIYPYKGIQEFLDYYTRLKKELSYKIYVVGKCSDEFLKVQLLKYQSNDIIFDFRSISFEELKTIISITKYVLFPYIGDSISSSGVLMDTIALGGVSIAPNKGAFKDINAEGLCLIYDDYEELFLIIQSGITIDENKTRQFLNNNSWESFVSYILRRL
ncbi:hypothetical protein [uncultured Bacteroides sp.]|uniref:hypothetical protein n=1 Tax=uncultured Bacteroides sp. TaxID=162156 RepID=UPI002AAB261F|nr:hypothetical protein [uncultured Bacteroides sp.]